MPKILIDSSVFVSYFGSDSNTTPSQLLWKHIASQNVKIINSSLVVAETLHTLSQQKIANLSNIYNTLKQIDTTPLDEEFVDRFVDYVSKSPCSLRSSDMVIAFTAKLHSAVLITWDKRLLDNPVCPTLTPNQYILNR